MVDSSGYAIEFPVVANSYELAAEHLPPFGVDCEVNGRVKCINGSSLNGEVFLEIGVIRGYPNDRASYSTRRKRILHESKGKGIATY